MFELMVDVSVKLDQLGNKRCKNHGKEIFKGRESAWEKNDLKK